MYGYALHPVEVVVYCNMPCGLGMGVEGEIRVKRHTRASHNRTSSDQVYCEVNVVWQVVTKYLKYIGQKCALLSTEARYYQLQRSIVLSFHCLSQSTISW